MNDDELTGQEISKTIRTGLTAALRRALEASTAAIKEVQEKEALAKSEALGKTSAGMNISRILRLDAASKKAKAAAPAATPAPAVAPVQKTSAGMNLSRAARLSAAEVKAKPAAPAPVAPKPVAAPAAKNEELGYGGNAGAGADQSTAPMAKKNSVEGLPLAGTAIPPKPPGHSGPKLPGVTPAGGASRPGGYKLPGLKSRPAVPVHTSARHANSEIGGMKSVAANAAHATSMGKSELCSKCSKPLHKSVKCS